MFEKEKSALPEKNEPETPVRKPESFSPLEIKENEAKRIEEIVSSLQSSTISGEQNIIEPQQPRINVEEYISKYVPEYVEIGSTPSLVYKITQVIGRLKNKEVKGKESLPEGEKLFIAGHRGGETPKLIGALDEKVHIVSAERVNWTRGLFSMIMKKLEMVPVRETLSHLSKEKKVELMNRVPAASAPGYREVAKNNAPANTQNIRAMAALLAAGENVAIFAEGLFTYGEGDERKAYAGYALVAREYRKITGKDLPIIPTAIKKEGVTFGNSFFLDSQNKMGREELENMATEKLKEVYGS